MFFKILFELLNIVKYLLLIGFIAFIAFPLFPKFAIGLLVFAVMYFISLMYDESKKKHIEKHW